MTSERLKQLLSYDPLSGIFTWRINPSPRKRIGDVAGCRNCRYIQIQCDNVLYLAHRLAWLYCHGVFPKDELDHRNGDKHDNRIDNLREATNAQNKWNRGPLRNGLKGAFFSKDRKRKAWIARIGANGGYKYLGRYHTELEAHQAYVVAAEKLHGEFAKTL